MRPASTRSWWARAPNDRWKTAREKLANLPLLVVGWTDVGPGGFMFRILVSGLFVAVFGCCSSAWAATIQPIDGETLVNRGDGYIQILDSVQGNAGDVVMVRPNGRATIIYADGCEQTVLPEEVVTVSAQSPCEAGPAVGNNAGKYLIGGALVAGTVAGIILLTGDDDDEGTTRVKKRLQEDPKPASP